MNTERLLRDRDYSFVMCRNIESYDPNHPFFSDWRMAQSSIVELGKKCLTYDRNGLNLYWASEPVEKIKCSDLKGLANMFQAKQPLLMNNLAGAIDEVFTYFFSRRGWKADMNGEIVIVLIDHLPPESETVVETLLDASHKMGDKKEHDTNFEFGMTFIQIGDDPRVAQFITYLDSNIVELGGKDLVDAKHWHMMRKMTLAQLLQEALTD